MFTRNVSRDMNAYVGSESRSDPRHEPLVPAYGPVDAVLGFGLFYLVVRSVTPTVVDAVTGVLSVSPSAVRFGLAAALWFVLAVTMVDQVTRQLAALGLFDHRSVGRGRSPAIPSESQALGYLVLVVLGGVVAGWTFGPALDALAGLIDVLVPLDGPVPVGDALVVVVFFVAFGAAAWAADRLVVGGTRILLAD